MPMTPPAWPLRRPSPLAADAGHPASGMTPGDLGGPEPEATVAFLVCDSGLKYLSTDLYPCGA